VVVTEQARPVHAEYVHTGQGRDRRLRRRRSHRARIRLWRIEVTVVAIALVVTTVLLSAWPAVAPPRPTPPGITRIRSGLVMGDSFSKPVSVRDLMDRYAFDGSAGPELGWQAGTAGGLDIGVHPHPGWRGWFAVTIHAAGAAVAWHVTMAQTPHAPVGEQEAVFAVQSASTQHNGTINYVVVAALSDRGHTTLQVGFAHGVLANAVTRILWQDSLRTRAPLSFPLTVRTDGRHTLSVWFGWHRIYHDTHLHMDNPRPFQAYLEVQAKDSGYVSNFKDFWVAHVAPVTVTGLVPGSHVSLRTAERVVTATANRAGYALLEVPPPVLVGTGTLTITTGGHVRSFTHLAYAGGDELSVRPT
jgi:hypothetical protein